VIPAFMVFQFKIQLKGIAKPPVWRKIAVPANFTFLRFHHVIQEAFGWENDHLFEFKDKEYDSDISISIPMEGGFMDFDIDASEIKLSAIFKDKFQNFLYIYDFGDDWVHVITLESTSNDKQKTAVCLSGKGACPPEDCGGIYGYAEIKRIFETMPKSEEANNYREWLGLNKKEVWDPEYIDIEEINMYLEDI
jgi:hypothetical protein